MKIVEFLVWTYQRFLSPWFGSRCRFEPSCSRYFLEALRARGLLMGTVIGMWRLLRCQPLSRGGWDPVRPKRANE